jgi:hypothetical protein
MSKFHLQNLICLLNDQQNIICLLNETIIVSPLFPSKIAQRATFFNDNIGLDAIYALKQQDSLSGTKSQHSGLFFLSINIPVGRPRIDKQLFGQTELGGARRARKVKEIR